MRAVRLGDRPTKPYNPKDEGKDNGIIYQFKKVNHRKSLLEAYGNFFKQIELLKLHY